MVDFLSLAFFYQGSYLRDGAVVNPIPNPSLLPRIKFGINPKRAPGRVTHITVFNSFSVVRKLQLLLHNLKLLGDNRTIVNDVT